MASTSMNGESKLNLVPTREFRAGSHQALLAANGRDTFYVPELQKAINGPSSPLARFLPQASYTVAARVPGETSGGARVTYSISESDVACATPLRSEILRGESLALPRSEIDAFVAAAKSFLSQVNELTPLQQQCRRELRLPDPKREPDAYWVLGQGLDRRLIVLWGCERFSRTSVSLDHVAEHLKTCEMSWADKQQLGLDLALDNNELLSAFLAIPHPEDGSLVLRGEPIALKQLRPFRSLGKKTWQQFDRAAREFVRKAEKESTSPFEAELRRHFKLPSLEAKPGAFFSHGSKFVINVMETDSKDGLPPAPVGEILGGHRGSTTEQLAKKVRFQVGPWLTIGGLAATAAVVGAIAWVMRPDRVAPLLSQVEAVSPYRLQASFNEAIKVSDDALAFVDDKRRITKLRVDEAKPATLIADLEAPLEDGENYALVVTEKVTDLSGNSFVRADAAFTYFDTKAPALVERIGISAGGMSNQDLVLSFDKPLDDQSLTINAVQIAPVSAGEAGRRIAIRDVKLDPETKDGSRVIVTAEEPFQGRKQYALSIKGISDKAKKPNRVLIEALPFEYKDLLPPSIRSVVATGSMYAIDIEYSKPVDLNIALKENTYSIERLGGEKGNLKLLPGGAKADSSGKIVTLHIERSTIIPSKYRLKVAEAADRIGNSISQPISKDFEFADAAMRTSPKIKNVQAEDISTRLSLEFDRGLSAGSVTADKFTVLSGDRGPSSLNVTAAALDNDDAKKVILTLSSNPTAGTLYAVKAQGLQDVFGSLQETPELREFRPAGSGRAQTNLNLTKSPTLLPNQRIRIIFDNVITQKSAADKSNYTLTPSIEISSVNYEIKKPDDGSSAFAIVDLVLSTAPNSPISLAAKNLQIEGDPLGNLFRLRPKPVSLAER